MTTATVTQESVKAPVPALVPGVRAQMGKPENRFWTHFFHLAVVEMDRNAPAGKKPPWEPSPELRRLYGQAIWDYGGGQYSEVSWLASVFKF